MLTVELSYKIALIWKRMDCARYWKHWKDTICAVIKFGWKRRLLSFPCCRLVERAVRDVRECPLADGCELFELTELAVLLSGILDFCLEDNIRTFKNADMLQCFPPYSDYLHELSFNFMFLGSKLISNQTFSAEHFEQESSIFSHLTLQQIVIAKFCELARYNLQYTILPSRQSSYYLMRDPWRITYSFRRKPDISGTTRISKADLFFTSYSHDVHVFQRSPSLISRCCQTQWPLKLEQLCSKAHSFYGKIKSNLDLNDYCCAVLWMSK